MNLTSLSRSLLIPITLLGLLAGCGKQKLLKENPESFAIQENKVAAAQQREDVEATMAQIEKLIATYPDNPKVPEYKLQLADYHLKEGQFAPAFERYQQFCRLYPAHEKVEYARHHAILAKFYQTLKISSDCDSSDTEETIKMCDAYLNDNAMRGNRNDITDIRNTCEDRLIDKEVHVFNAYLRRGKYQSAQNRLDNLKKNYLPKDQSLSPRLLYLECKLAQQQNQADTAMKNFETLVSQFPDSQFTRMAEGLLNRRAFATHAS